MADTKVSALTAATPVATDELYLVDDPGGTPSSKRSTVANVLAVSHDHAADEITSGTLANARVAESNVTQHQGALSITESQISDLGTYLEQEAIEDLVGAMFTGNTETLITVTYQDGDGTIDLVVDDDLSNYDNTTSAFLTGITNEDLDSLNNVTITAPSTGEVLKYNGSIWVNDTDEDTPTDWSVAVDNNVVPDGDGTRSLGNTSNRWLSVNTDSIDLNGVTISGTTLANPGVDAMVFYDQSAARWNYATFGNGLETDGTVVQIDDTVVAELTGGTFSGAINFSGTTHEGIKLNSLTTTQRNALTPAAGMVIYNSTTGNIEGYDGSTWLDLGAGSGGGITDVVDDTTPQLGGDLDVNSNSIVSTSDGNIVLAPNGTGSIVLDGLSWPQADGTADQMLTTDGAGQIQFATPFAEVVEDTTPELGGDLDTATFSLGIDLSNENGSALAAGDPVYLSSSGSVTASDADTESTLPVFGIAVDAISDLATGRIATYGTVTGVDLSGLTASVGDDLYVASGGGLTNVAPTGASQFQQRVGYILSTGASGQIFVDIKDITTPIADAASVKDVNDNEIIEYNVVSSAVNHVQIGNNSTGNAATLAAVGGDTNIDLELSGKGTGRVVITEPKGTYRIHEDTTAGASAHTLVDADMDSIVEMNNASAQTLTIPTNASVAFPIGTVVMVTQMGAGTTTIAGDTGVTLSGNGGSASGGSTTIQTQYGMATLYKRATDSWVVSGDIAAVS